MKQHQIKEALTSHIFLTGFMGAGKSTIGPMLAHELEYQFYDLDTFIEEKQRKTIREIFNQLGEKEFRKIEAESLRQLVEQTKSSVIAVGGGTPCYHDNMSWMNKKGVTVYLSPALEVLVQRLAPLRDHRPLLSDVPEDQLSIHIAHMISMREPYYSQAQLTWRLPHCPTKTELMQLLKYA